MSAVFSNETSDALSPRKRCGKRCMWTLSCILSLSGAGKQAARVYLSRLILKLAKIGNCFTLTSHAQLESPSFLLFPLTSPPDHISMHSSPV